MTYRRCELAPYNRIVFKEKQTDAQLEKAARRLKVHCNDILLDQQQTLKDLIQAKAPKGETGDLRESVFVEVLEYKRGPTLRGGVKGVAYAVYHEFGTSYMQPPRPFLRPALHEMAVHIRNRRKGKR